MCIEIGFSYSSHQSFLKNFKTNKVRFVNWRSKLSCSKKSMGRLVKNIMFVEILLTSRNEICELFR